MANKVKATATKAATTATKAVRPMGGKAFGVIAKGHRTENGSNRFYFAVDGKPDTETNGTDFLKCIGYYGGSVKAARFIIGEMGIPTVASVEKGSEEAARGTTRNTLSCQVRAGAKQKAGKPTSHGLAKPEDLKAFREVIAKALKAYATKASKATA